MSGFKEYFCLKDRNSFDVDVLNNPDDAKYFFDVLFFAFTIHLTF